MEPLVEVKRRRRAGFFFSRVTSPVVFLNCYKTSFALSILSLDSLPWSKSRDKAIGKSARMHIFNVVGLVQGDISGCNSVLGTYIFFSSIHPCRTIARAVSGRSLPSCSSVGFIVNYNTLTGLLVASPLAFLLPCLFLSSSCCL